MNPRHLQHFLRIAQSGSLSRAADQLGLSQSMLSRELRSLEDVVGVKLLQRLPRGIALTAAGEALKKRAESILTLMDALPEEVRQAADQPAGRVSVGMPATMTASVTAPLLRAYRARYPGVKLRVSEGTGAQLRGLLMAREVDLALLSAPVSGPHLIVRPVLLEPCVLVMPADSPLARRRRVSLRDLAALPLVMPSPPNYTRALVDETFEKHGYTPDIVLETDDSSLLMHFVANGMGHAILPASAMASPWPGMLGIRHAQIDGVKLTRMLASPAGVAMSLGTQRLGQMLCELIRELVENRILAGDYVGP